MCSIATKIFIASILLVVICEFDVVSCGGNRRRRVNVKINEIKNWHFNLIPNFKKILVFRKKINY